MPLETALETVLAGSPYAARIKPHVYWITERGTPTAKEDIPVTGVYNSVTATFEGEDLSAALQDIAVAAGVTIAIDPNVSGSVWAVLDKVSLETALETLLAGTPFVVTKTPDYTDYD